MWAEQDRTFTPGDVRGTVPLLGGHIADLSPMQRLEVAPGIVVAGLNEAERARVQFDSGGAYASSRIEFFGFLPRFDAYALDSLPETEESWAWQKENHSHGLRLSLLVDLLTLAVRVPPHHGSVHADVWDGRQWKRIGPVVFVYTGRERTNHSSLPMTRLGTWGALCQNWPAKSSPQVDLAMSYYVQSLRDRQSDTISRAYLSAAIAWEVLLGHKSPGEISRSLAQRGAHLVAAGPAAATAFSHLKRLYGLRSKVVHDGKEPGFDDLTLLQQFLMAALPRVAALAASSHTELVRALDDANFGAAATVDALHVSGSTWWNYVDFPSLCGQHTN